MKPYIGITGFMSREEVDFVLSKMPENSDRLLMVGVLASSKTLVGKKNRWPNRYPEMDEIAEIFIYHPLALNLIHYNTREPETLSDQLSKMTILVGVNLQGFQLNIAWPSPREIALYRKKYHHKIIVLQIGSHAFEKINHSPKKLATKVAAEYEDLVDYILLDPSGGYGKFFNPYKIRAYLEALREKDLHIGLGIAGGLGPKTLDLLELLITDFSDLSIDAEGKLRDENDNLDLEKAGKYLQGSFEIFSSK